jgi:hypothetical protein
LYTDSAPVALKSFVASTATSLRLEGATGYIQLIRCVQKWQRYKSESIGVVLSKMAHDLVGDKRRWIIAKIPAQSQTFEVYNTSATTRLLRSSTSMIEEGVQSRLIGWGRNGRDLST